MTAQAFYEGYRVNNNGEIINPRGKIIKSFLWWKNPKISYKRFNFRGCKIQVHHLIAMQKFGIEWLFGELLVRHKNDNSLDNSIDNIILGTKSDNWYDMSEDKKEKIIKSTTKAHEARRLFSNEQIRTIRNSKDVKTYKQLAIEFNCNIETIRSIVKLRTYKHVSA